MTTDRKPDELLEDKRPIRCVFSGEAFYEVGADNVTRIVAYGEPGMYCMIPWFAIYVGDEIKARLPAQEWGVRYD